ncbi:MAG: RHS repeat-associated core domain-containing protein, partial [Phycisphaerae bacterium]|nr:RHS repeat-associated core domain-containing protein [Phycisphaerae bacterium]
ILRQKVSYRADGKVALVETYDSNDFVILSEKFFSYDTRGRIEYVFEQIEVGSYADVNYYYADTTSASLLGPAGDKNYHIQIVDAESQSTYIQLNEYGMTKKILYPSGDYEQTEYTHEYGFKYILPYKKAVWDNSGVLNWIQYEYDSYGKVTKILYPDGGYLEYEYGPRCFGKFGRVEKIKDYRNSDDRLGGLGTIYDYSYDIFDRLKTYNDSGEYTIYYDWRAADNQKTSITVFDHIYDMLIYDVNYTYDMFGRLEVVDGNTCYNTADANIASFKYDDNGNRTQLKYWLTGEINDVNYAIDYSYNINNNLIGITAGRPEGEPNYTFDASIAGNIDGLGRLKYAVETITYPPDVNGNRSHTSSFTYDMRSSLKTASITNINGSGWAGNYLYKKDGNIYRKFTSGIPPRYYQYDTTPDNGTEFDSDIMTKAGGDNLTWDKNGQLVSKPQISFEYNWDGKLRRAETGEQETVEFKYDPMGNRIYKNSSVSGKQRYIVDIAGKLPTILWGYDPDYSPGYLESIYFYTPAGQILRQDNAVANSSFYYIHDRLGSVRLITDNCGTVVNSYSYNPFGEDLATECTETTENRFKFTGQWFDDEFSQYYLRARQYDPQMMRFTARDPVRGKQQSPLTLHPNLYCGNDSINRIDTDGKWAIVIGGNISGSLNDFFGSISGVTRGMGIAAGSLFRQGLIGQLVNEFGGKIQGSVGLATVIGMNNKGKEAFYGSMYWVAGGVSTNAGVSAMATYGFSPNANKLSDFSGAYTSVGVSSTEGAFGVGLGGSGSFSVSKGWSNDTVLFSIGIGVAATSGQNTTSIFGETGYSWVADW